MRTVDPVLMRISPSHRLRLEGVLRPEMGVSQSKTVPAMAGVPVASARRPEQ